MRQRLPGQAGNARKTCTQFRHGRRRNATPLGDAPDLSTDRAARAPENRQRRVTNIGYSQYARSALPASEPSEVK
jgi:hypothetical protein